MKIIKIHNNIKERRQIVMNILNIEMYLFKSIKQMIIVIFQKQKQIHFAVFLVVYFLIVFALSLDVLI